ncbi:MAG: glycosyltransferase, partial [Alphaproteobacteria bacterium]
MSHPPLFSIVTVTKNNPAGFQKTLKSLQNQCFKDFQWIVINGGNEKDALVPQEIGATKTCITEPDEGPFDAMNKAIPLCRGTFTLFLNAGDRIAENETLYNLANFIPPNCDFIYGDSFESIKE